MKAAIYSRKSVFTGKGESIENQVQMCKNYAKKNLNINEFIIYEDEGFSGGNINRPKFKELLLDVKKNKFNVLICYRLDRISRNVADFSSTLELLQTNNISFVSIKEQFDTSTPMGKAMVYIASVFAQLERETIAERIRDNMLELAKTGRWLGGQTPLGFKSKKITCFDNELKERSFNKLSPINNELNLVKLIYNKYLETYSIHKTLKHLLSNNIKGKNGGEFASMSINDILRNPVYVQSNELVVNYLKSKGIQVCGIPNGNGILTYNKKNSKYKAKNIDNWIAAVSNHMGIISPDSWLQVQNSLDNNSRKSNPRKGTSKRALLSGILKCAMCGSPMRVCYGKPRKDGSKNYYYTCTMKAQSGKIRCNNPNVRGDYLENEVISHLKELNTDLIIEELSKYKKEIASIKNISIVKNLHDEIEGKKTQLENLINQLSKIKEPMASDFIAKKINQLGNDIKNLQLKFKYINEEKKLSCSNTLNIDMILEFFKDFKTFFDNIENLKNHEFVIQRKRYLIETIVDSIFFDGTTNEITITLWGSKNLK
ncbi:recombinase family protein [Clostridium botulinum]|uniref:Serine recombinase n=1 Tax=Clostridium botulinum TaxID=1491 RepID=A0A9Q1UXS1_CLOBO|nr:recombinase family protein [Clostridium botulinum]AEB75976.1 resolvase [Clostridium botulinum BKT015925]KEI00535.1 serine recombinase [Clostridium botulinum D str. 16868]KEI01360.1 serine recombinase [Clostridium botulinum C/D str. Sp77]KOA73483.1 serine recombinase [Clostridium botulinum]KOA79149.1 serine recombinase [Clostridium botulinum]